MIALSLALIGVVVMITTGVAVSSSGDDHLTFLGVGVETTTAQVFLTGAIFAWLFVLALLLLRYGLQRSNTRCAQLAVRRARRSSARGTSGSGAWLGFGPAEAPAHEVAGYVPAEPAPPETCSQTQVWPDAQHGGPWFGAGVPGAPDGGQWFGTGGPGAPGDDGGPPQRGDGGPDLTHRSVAVAGDQAGSSALRDLAGPGARSLSRSGSDAWNGRADRLGRIDGAGGAGGGGFVGIRVDRRGQGRQIGG